MAWYPGATRMELPEASSQPKIRPTQFLVHSLAAPWTARRTFEYWRDSTSLESHFGLGYEGDLGQYIGTEVRADANAAANLRPDGTGAVSVETASNLNATDPWTDAQIGELIKLGVWVHERHEVPLRLCRTADDPGYGWHRMFNAWNPNAHSCPGDRRVEQFRNEVFPEIVAQAADGEPVGGGTRPTVDLSKLIAAARRDPAASGTPVSYKGVGRVERALVAEGLLDARYVDAHFGAKTVAAYAAWQRRLGYRGDDANGIPGKTSLRRLGERYGFDVKD